MWRVPVFFCACGGACAGFCACGGACAGFLVIWGAFLYARVVSLMKIVYLFGAKRCNLRSPLLLLSSPRKISNFRSSILPFPITHLRCGFFHLVVVCLLFVVCCRCRCLVLVLLVLFLLLCCNFIFLTFWLNKTNTFSSFAKIARAHKKTGHTTRIKKKNYNTTNKWKCSRSQTKKLATRKRTKKTTVALT